MARTSDVAGILRRLDKSNQHSRFEDKKLEDSSMYVATKRDKEIQAIIAKYKPRLLNNFLIDDIRASEYDRVRYAYARTTRRLHVDQSGTK